VLEERADPAAAVVAARPVSGASAGAEVPLEAGERAASEVREGKTAGGRPLAQVRRVAHALGDDPRPEVSGGERRGELLEEWPR
jgi:hypothetical protein